MGLVWSCSHRIEGQAVVSRPQGCPAPPACDGVSSIQLTFDESIAPEGHHMPEGGFRLAIINCWNLEAGSRMRETLRAMFVPRCC